MQSRFFRSSSVKDIVVAVVAVVVAVVLVVAVVEKLFFSIFLLEHF